MRYSKLNIGLCVAADVHDVVERLVHSLERFGIGDRQSSSDKGNRTERAEIETANIKIAAGEKSSRKTARSDSVKLWMNDPIARIAIVFRP